MIVSLRPKERVDLDRIGVVRIAGRNVAFTSFTGGNRPGPG
jgi:hypothetical protein